tara:strand:- start:10928 stop:11221 length:294 start_codon:yes stop_codon:yes gene_type:complete
LEINNLNIHIEADGYMLPLPPVENTEIAEIIEFIGNLPSDRRSDAIGQTWLYSNDDCDIASELRRWWRKEKRTIAKLTASRVDPSEIPDSDRKYGRL